MRSPWTPAILVAALAALTACQQASSTSGPATDVAAAGQRLGHVRGTRSRTPRRSPTTRQLLPAGAQATVTAAAQSGRTTVQLTVVRACSRTAHTARTPTPGRAGRWATPRGRTFSTSSTRRLPASTRPSPTRRTRSGWTSPPTPKARPPRSSTVGVDLRGPQGGLGDHPRSADRYRAWKGRHRRARGSAAYPSTSDRRRGAVVPQAAEWPGVRREPVAADRTVRGRSAGGARADGGHHQRRVPHALPGARRRALRLRDDHLAGARRAPPADHADDHLRRRRAPEVAAALRRRPGDGARRGPDDRPARTSPTTST